MMKSPTLSPDRLLECQEAIEPSFRLVANSAIQSDWTPDEVANAMLALALADVLALRSNPENEQTIRDAIKVIHNAA